MLHFYTCYTCYTCYTSTASLQQIHSQRAMTGPPPAGPLGYRWVRIGTRATPDLLPMRAAIKALTPLHATPAPTGMGFPRKDGEVPMPRTCNFRHWMLS